MKVKTTFVAIAVFVGILLGYTEIVDTHCDTLDGPVVTAAKMALEKGDVTPVLKWVKKEHEEEIREAFKQTLNIRTKGPEAKGLAERYFFETLVRIHRAGEGAPYAGLKPPGFVEPSVAAADQALENGSVDDLVKDLVAQVGSGVKMRFTHALEKKKHADESVEAGREFVGAYVEYVHYVERLYKDAKGAHLGEPNDPGYQCPSHRE